jgi:replication-associated recombination protein RarA
MAKEIESGGSHGKQTDLNGQTVEDENTLGYEDIGLVKSCLQKTIRRGKAEASMYWALRLAEANSWSCWRRLSVIADEDVGQPEAIVAVDVLCKKFMAMKKGTREKELSWDAKRCVVCAAKILAESPKDRRADEFLELMEAIEKDPESKLLESAKTIIDIVPDEALDMHTVQGRKLGRGDLFWYEVSSETVNKTSAYEKWHKWFKPLMIEITKAKRVSQ